MPEGVLAMTVDPREGQRYQGIVALEGADLAECLSVYFANSEQLPTRFWLKADTRRARGFMLQALPADRLKDPEARTNSWQHLTTLADTLRSEEHTSELQSRENLVCRLLLEKKKNRQQQNPL